MPSISILTDELIGKIRAGEVVERPASVVKELVENSLDAGAKNISIQVSGGGTGLISVSDDGEGMDAEDALLCFERHSTSKLSGEAGLLDVRTMGFRGEAVPSIASVSKVRLITSKKGSRTGSLVESEGASRTSSREAPASGTRFEVRDLFYNTPARKKFLKTKKTELLHVVNAVTRAALSSPAVGFRLAVEGDETINLPPASGLRERLVQVYGAEFMEGMVEVGVETGGISIEGFVSRPGNFRNSRSHQYIFINGRAVREPSLAHAALNAYQDGGQGGPGGRFPALFLHYQLDPGTLDVNVHPQKEEVRFADSGAVYRFTLHTVRRALGFGGGGGGEVEEAAGHAGPEADAAFVQGGGGYTTAAPMAAAGHVMEALAVQYGAETRFINLGESFVAYPAQGGGVTLIDTHAAHERVLYEKLIEGVELNAHRLLFPRQVKLSPAEHRVVVGNSELLAQMGMEVEDFGDRTVIVRTLPEALEEADMRGILADVAHELTSGTEPGKTLREAVAARVACHGSVRGGARRLGPAELSALIEQLGHARDPEHCPHGRPTRVRLGLDELRKMFKRT